MKKTITGFTIVELLIVIVVIAILAAISIVAYTGIQARANDSKMKSAMKQFETAIILWAQDHPLPIRGGSGSTVAASNGECSDGNNGFLASSSYTCTVEDALISAGALPSGFLLGMPRNTYYSSYTNGRTSTMFYSCPSGASGRYGLYWTLQNPTPADSASIDDTLASCGNSTTLRDTYGMRAGKVIQF